jgi:hypothetical protein
MAVMLAAAVAVMGLLFAVVDEPEPAHPEWEPVMQALESRSWPLVRAARYDPVNHFVLVDLRPGVAAEVAVRMACEDVRPLIDDVDATAGFALYDAPDRVMAHHGDCTD